LTDLTPLEHLSDVTTLVLTANPSLDDNDLACLSRMSKLKTLELFGCLGITGKGLSHLRNLPIESLWLDSCKQITTEAVLELNKLSLSELRLKGTSVTVTKGF